MDETSRPSDKLRAALGKNDDKAAIEALGDLLDHFGGLLTRLVVATEASAIAMQQFAEAVDKFNGLIEVENPTEDEPLPGEQH